MARFSNELLTQLKNDISLLRLAEDHGVKLKRHGKDYIGHCPFHDDRTPSFVISPASNLWNCLGACGEGGTVIDWVMKIQGVSFRHAVELLNTDTSALAAKEGSHAKKTTVPKLPTPVTLDANDQTLLDQVVDYYHDTLKQSPEALDYLARRGLDDAELIDAFKLGYANRTLGLRLPQKNRKAGAAVREQLTRIGLYRETGREHFNGSLVIPIISYRPASEVTVSAHPCAHGIPFILNIYGRKLLDNLRKGTPVHTYLPGAHVGVFNEVGLLHSEEVILCESLIDALTFWRWGFRHVTCSYGINGFTDDILQALLNNKIKRVLIAYDRDAAGDKAASALAEKLMAHGLACFRVLFPKNMDANSYACQMSPPQKSLALVLRKAQWLGQGEAPAIAPPASSLAANTAVESQPELPEIEQSSFNDDELAESGACSALDTCASPMPALPLADVEVIQNDNELFITLGTRIYRVRGLQNNRSFDQLKINLMVKHDEQFHLDKLDLYSSKQRQVFINQACVELGVKDGVIKKDLGKVLLVLEEQQAQQQESSNEKAEVAIDDESRKVAMALLHDPQLLDRVLSDFNCAGVVGEETNKLAGYLACVSRKLDRPLAVIIQSSSAAGKSSLMDAILALMPEEERVQYSAMTGQSLFYMGETNLKNKILAIAEEEGASNASYSLKLLQSEGEITMASTGKDDSTGNLVTKEYKVQGPVMLFLTTTGIDIDEEIMNRCLVLSVNESREQTQAIHAAQRSKRTLKGLQNKLEKERVIQLHRNAQRLLKPLQIINPYADQLTFLDDKTRTRRDHEKYLTLIDSIALLHQYQREVKTVSHDGKEIEYIEVTLSDITIANKLAHEILGKTLDELPPQTRKLLRHIQQFVQHACEAQKIEHSHFRFSRKQVRDSVGWTDFQIKKHINRLQEMEYLLVHRGGRGQSFVYELLYQGEGENGESFVLGLRDLESHIYDKKKKPPNAKKERPNSPQVAVKVPLSSPTVNELQSTSPLTYRHGEPVLSEIHV